MKSPKLGKKIVVVEGPSDAGELEQALNDLYDNGYFISHILPSNNGFFVVAIETKEQAK